MDYRFCPLCGTALEGEYVVGQAYPHCPEGHYTAYPNQIAGVAGLVRRAGEVLLERRAITPGYGLWAMPGGMLEVGEEPSEGLAREIWEETGLTVQVGRLYAVRGGQRVLILFYEATVTGGGLRTSPESLEVAWIPVADIPWAAFAFSRHTDVLRAWINGQGG